MYSIFSTKTKKHHYLEEGEPPPKKLLTEEGILIKKMAENQLKTNITLVEQLNKEKEFISSESFTNITGYVRGKTGLKDFQTRVAYVEELNSLKRKGLSDNDIEIYREFINLGPEFWVKYKNINENVLYKQINEIKTIVTTTGESDSRNSVPCTSENQEEYLNSLNFPTGLLTLAYQNEMEKDILPGPMNELPSLEKQFMLDLQEYSSCDIKKIRKKARSMGNKINNLEMAENLVNREDYKQSATIRNKNSQQPTQWDVKERPYFQKTVEIIDKDKVYGCKTQNWYTIKDSKIIKLDEKKAIPENTQNDNEKSKLTLEEIKSIPRFMNYDPGMQSKVLYLKNLEKNITENCLRNLLKQFQDQCYSVRVLSGKMKGQAFIEFQNAVQASEALEALNGVVLERKPIIVQYGKKNTQL